MALTDTDRRRFAVATAITLVALPALWWANESANSGAPGIATVGVELAAGAPADDAANGEDPDGSVAPVFLDGPAGEVGASQPKIAVPAAPAVERIRATASYRRSTPARSICLVPGVVNGQTITVVNLDNNRSVRCTTVLVEGAAGDEMVLHNDLFSEIADLTDAPIPVEIRR